MSNKVFTKEELQKIKSVIEHGVTAKQDMKIMAEGLRENITDIAKELDIEKKLLNNAIRMAYKASLKGSIDNVIAEDQEQLDETEHLMKAINS